MSIALTLTGCGEADHAQHPLFDFMRLNTDGTPYAGDVDFERQPWACVTDRITGLTWEVKSAQPGLRFKDNTYTWYNPDERGNGGDAGTRNGGRCSGSDCDTHAYVAAVNAQGLCGFHDWRMPLREEWASLNDPRVKFPGPTVDTRFFPESHTGQYWTGTAYGFHYGGAWAWSLDYGYDRVDWKKTPKYLRLVRGAAVIKKKNRDD